MKDSLTKQQSKKDCLLSCRITKKMYECYIRWGRALNAGTKDGQCELGSIAITFMGKGLMEIEEEIKIRGWKLDDILKIKERYITNPVFVDLLKNNKLNNEVTDEVFDFILRTLSHRNKQLKGGLQENG